MKIRALIIALFVGALPALAGAQAPQQTSALWGNAGETWTPESRLPDFSFAGYRFGEKPIPEVAALDLAPFHIRGDGQTDDAPAIQAAIDAAVHGGAIVLPPGRFVLGKALTIKRAGVVLRGAGAGKTVLVIPQSLSQLVPAAQRKGKSIYAFSGGFIVVRGFEKGVKLAGVTLPAPRGSSTLTLDAEPKLAPGTVIRLRTNNDESLGKLLLGGKEPGDVTPDERKNYLDWAARVKSCEGKTLTLDRPLRVDVRPAWQAEVWSCVPTLEDVGIEGLTFEFPGVEKKPHLLEEGFNAIHFFGAANSWVRDVEAIDADNVLIVHSSRACTFERITARAVKRASPTGHHALWASGGSQDCLFTDFNIDTQFVHDLTVEGFVSGNVFMNGKGRSLNLDHHRNIPYENLFTHLHVGDGRRIWQSSGDPDRGPHSGVRETFWNITAAPDSLPGKPPPFPQANLIGVSGLKPRAKGDKETLVELPGGVVPENLYESQLRRRLGKAAESAAE